MLAQFAVGSSVIIGTVIVQALFIGAAVRALQWARPDANARYRLLKDVGLVAALSLWMLAGLSVSVWAWAGVYLLLGVFGALEPAMYFSIVSFTTLGFGDVIVEKGNWRLLSGLAAANGLILFSLSTAFLIEAMRAMHMVNPHRD